MTGSLKPGAHHNIQSTWQPGTRLSMLQMIVVTLRCSIPGGSGLSAAAAFCFLLQHFEWSPVHSVATALERRHPHRYPELKVFFEEDRRAPKSDTFASSIIYNPTVQRKPGNATTYGLECGSCSLSDVHNFSTVWLADADPGFASVSAMNFSISPADVLAHIPDWKNIPFSSIGLLDGVPIGPLIAVLWLLDC